MIQHSWLSLQSIILSEQESINDIIFARIRLDFIHPHVEREMRVNLLGGWRRSINPLEFGSRGVKVTFYL